MIALDTNILVRYFVGADDNETQRATDLIEAGLQDGLKGHIAAVTLCEIVWVLRNRYKFGYETQSVIIRLLLESSQLIIEHDDCARAALATRHADIADAMIHFIGAKLGCTKTLSFDRKFARLEGVELLA